jgi:glycosyltransferase involved in cell wall biosynthesis
MRLFINALGATAGGGLTYLWNVLPELAGHKDIQVSVLADRAAGLTSSPTRKILNRPEPDGTFSRFLWEQSEIPELVKQEGPDILLCTGNFALWKSPVPQILLSRNSLYTSRDFSHDLWRRREYRLLGETYFKSALAKSSIRRAELTVAPSEAFARQIEDWCGRRVLALHHGFDRERFFGNGVPLPPPIFEKLQPVDGTVSLLFVSHYNYYRNFETLFRALALLKARSSSQKLRLVLTCELSDGANPGNYRTSEAAALVSKLEIESNVVQLGAVDYSQLHHVYSACDLYVTPAYAETFAHPLVEAMASGLPIVASDIAVHREITDGAALFFDRFSPAGLADKVAECVNSPDLRSELRQKGMRRAREFSWKKHVERLIEIARSLTDGSSESANRRAHGSRLLLPSH